VLVLGAVALAQDAPPPTFPKPGSDIPGPFHVYNVTGKKKGNYHCLVSEFALNPVVMIVVRGVEDKDDGLRQFLAKLDNLIDKNPNTRLAGFAVFLSSTLKDVAREDDQREKLTRKIEDLFKMGGVKHIVLALDTPKRLAKWPLDEKADVIVVLYNEYRTLAIHNLTWEQLKPASRDMLSEKAKEVLDDVRQKFGAKRG
jgi:hypothetical protein